MTETLFDRESTLALLSLSRDLPSLPDYFVKIQNVANDPSASSHDLAQVIRSDQATTVMILKFANSPAYSPANLPVGELTKAIARIGTRETVHIAMAMSLMYGMILPTGMANIRRFWSHAFAVSLVCESLSKQIGSARRKWTHEQAFMAGLLHDIGRAALGMRVDLTYFEREPGRVSGMELIAAEERIYGVNHAEAGEHLLRLWGMPEPLCVAVGQHHNPASDAGLARLCFYANQFVDRYLSHSFSLEEAHMFITRAMTDHPIDIEQIMQK